LTLLADRAVLLLNEPYAGFDWDTYLKFWELVALRRASGHAVLIISRCAYGNLDRNFIETTQ